MSGCHCKTHAACTVCDERTVKGKEPQWRKNVRTHAERPDYRHCDDPVRRRAVGRQRHRLQNPHGHVPRLAAVDRMRARTGSRRAFPHLLGHHDAETAYRRATRSQIISAAAGHRHHMHAAGAGRLPRIDQLDQLRHRDRAAKPEPAVRLGGRMPARAATARRTGRRRRGARLRGNRADCDRRRLHHR